MMPETAARLRRGYVDIADGQVHYRLRPGGTETVVFLHQTASSSAMWERVMARWPGTETLVAFDTPGFGGSFDPGDTPDLARYAAWIGEATAALAPGRVHLVGHHTGAIIALSLAVTQPERAASLALVGPAVLDAAERAVFAGKLGKPFRPVRSGAHLLMNWEYLRVGGADAEMALLHREMIDMLRAWSARPHAYGAVWQADLEALYRQVACPTIALAARDDMLFASLDRLAAIRPDIACITLDHGGNFEPDLAPDALCAALAGHVSSLA